jgi:hypothetical protein
LLDNDDSDTRLTAEGSGQRRKAEGRRQKTEGRRQKTEGRRQKTGCGTGERVVDQRERGR